MYKYKQKLASTESVFGYWPEYFYRILYYIIKKTYEIFYPFNFIAEADKASKECQLCYWKTFWGGL